jgi:unsaturated rhamnogalacturonyl hydrolase
MKRIFHTVSGVLPLLLAVFSADLNQFKPAPVPGDLNVPASVWAERMVATAMTLWPDSFSNEGRRSRWSYDHGVVLRGVEGLWNNTGKGKYFNYIQHTMDHYVREDGSIYDYSGADYNIDYINNGKLVLLLYEVTGQTKYKKAADLLRNQLKTHPRTNEGGFWHKKIYPCQMWLDGLYMGAPFYAQYSRVFPDDTAFNDIANQFIYSERHTRDAKTGLLYHGWDESKQQQWANKETGVSPHFWGRAMGWYGMALVDVLDQFPAKHPGRETIIKILNRLAQAVIKVQDGKTGLWYNIVDLPDRPKNYREASASCMLVYTLLKGVRKGYLPSSCLVNAKKGYAGIITEFIETDANGQTNLKGTVSVSGLGGNPYRDGSYDYYMSERVVVNDPKGMGAFIQCANEMALASEPKPGKGKTVLLDRYFNSEKRKNEGGAMDYWHYVWEGKGHPGLTMWGSIFNKYGANLASLDVAPTTSNLAKASVYIIVDPDHVKDNPSPNYVSFKDARAISNWVMQGGVLVLMANDSANCDLTHFNKLANVFGITFTEKSRNMVKGNDFPAGEVHPNGKEVFKEDVKMYLKEVSVLKLRTLSTAVAARDGDVIMAAVKAGKGAVFAVGDPWLYNEYTDGRNLPGDFNNYRAAEMLSSWLLQPPFGVTGSAIISEFKL